VTASTLVMAVTATLALASADIRAQAVPDSLTAHRVRVHLSRLDRAVEGANARQLLRGTMTRITPDSVTLMLHPEASHVTIAMNGVYQVDVSRGVSPARTALTRGIGGALTWFLFGSFRDEDDQFGGGPTENALIWAGGGFVLGAVLGFVFPEERWQRVFRR
jgi:hypothetical protein